MSSAIRRIEWPLSSRENICVSRCADLARRASSRAISRRRVDAPRAVAPSRNEVRDGYGFGQLKEMRHQSGSLNKTGVELVGIAT